MLQVCWFWQRPQVLVRLSGHMPGNHSSNLSKILFSLAVMTSDKSLEKSDTKQNSETKDVMGNMLCTPHRRKVNVPNKIIYSSTDDEATSADQQHEHKKRRHGGQNIPKPTLSERSPLLVSKLRSAPLAAPSTHGYPSYTASGHSTGTYPVPYYNSRHVVMRDGFSPYEPMGRTRTDWVPSLTTGQVPPAPTTRPLPRPPARTPAPSSADSWSVTTLDSSASSSRWTPNLLEAATVYHRSDEMDMQKKGAMASEPKYIDMNNILVRFRKLTQFAMNPIRHPDTGVVFVLFCCYKTSIPPYGSLSIPTDLQLKTPVGTYGHIQRYDGFGTQGALRVMESKVRCEPIVITLFNDDSTRSCELCPGNPIAALTIRKDFNADATMEELDGQIHTI